VRPEELAARVALVLRDRPRGHSSDCGTTMGVDCDCIELLREPAAEYRVGGDMLGTLDAVAVAARDLFEALQQATRLALRQPPAPLATECRHCGRALQLGPTPGVDPLRFSSVSWLDANGSASCHGQVMRAQDPGTYVPHEPLPTRSDPTGRPLHRCPGCQMLHPYPLAEED